MIVHHVSAVDDFTPDFELTRYDFGCFNWDEDVEGKGCSCEFALVRAMATKLEGGLHIPEYDVGTAETG